MVPKSHTHKVRRSQDSIPNLYSLSASLSFSLPSLLPLVTFKK